MLEQAQHLLVYSLGSALYEHYTIKPDNAKGFCENFVEKVDITYSHINIFL